MILLPPGPNSNLFVIQTDFQNMKCKGKQLIDDFYIIHKNGYMILLTGVPFNQGFNCIKLLVTASVHGSLF